MNLRMSIQKKAIAAITVLMGALAFTLMSISLYHSSRAIRQELLMRGRIETNSLAYNASYATLINDSTALHDLLKGILAEREVLYARIVSADGTVLATLDRPVTIGETSPETMILDSDNMVEFQSPIRISDAAESGIELYEMGGEPDNQQAEESRVLGFAETGMTTSYIEETIGGMQRTMLWTTLLAVILATVITSIMVRVSIRPINELVLATGRVAAGEYDVKVTTPVRDDEVGDLAASFNKMTADLSASRNALVEKELLENLVVELKATQQQLVQAGKMAAIGQLAAGVAHEINNPLAGIMGYAQLASEHIRAKQQTGIPPAEIAKFAAYVENMERQSQRCKQIVQNLLRFARASSQEESQPVDVNAVARETITFLAHEFETHLIEVNTRLDEKIPRVRGDQGQLQQVFTNILINAVQAMRGPGTITVETSFSDGWIAIRLSDSGEGIAPENLEKIFEPFFTTKEIGKGTGLGLSVTYGLIRDMGGDISVQSSIGIGTTFTIKLPEADRADRKGTPSSNVSAGKDDTNVRYA